MVDILDSMTADIVGRCSEIEACAAGPGVVSEGSKIAVEVNTINGLLARLV